MAKKKTSFVVRVKRGFDGKFVYLSSLNGTKFSIICYESWFRKTNYDIQPKKSKKVRFTLEVEE